MSRQTIENVDKHPCSGHTSNGRMGIFGCTKAGNRKYKDKWWCFHHDPREKEKKCKASMEKWDREQKEDDKRKVRAAALLKRLGVEGGIEYGWRGIYQEAIVIDFEEVEKLLKELGR